MNRNKDKYNFRVYVSMDSDDLHNAIDESVYKIFTDQEESQQFADMMMSYGFSVVIWEYLAEE